LVLEEKLPNRDDWRISWNVDIKNFRETMWPRNTRLNVFELFKVSREAAPVAAFGLVDELKTLTSLVPSGN
jgi:hypothetical protein